ncbi:MAG: preprotein translocase subunit SecE [Cyanobacteria bacterium P01_H01_bin.119]
MVNKGAKSESSKDVSNASAPEGGVQIGKFLIGTKDELSKVVWPSRQQLVSESVAVILMVTLSASFIYLIDRLFGFISRQVF